MKKLLVLLVLALLAAPSAMTAQTPEGFDLSIRNIMRGPELYGREPAQVRWSADGQWIYFNWNAAGTAWNEPMRPYRVAPRAGATPERVSAAHMDSVGPMLAVGQKSNDGRMRLVNSGGDLWIQQIAGARVTLRRLTETVGNESNARFSVDGRHVYFVRDNNGYSFELATGLVRQLTDIRSGTAPRDPEVARGQRGAVVEQQRDLLQVIRDRAYTDSVTRAERREREGRALPVIWLPATERLVNISLSPDGRTALLSVFINATGTKGSDVPNYITADGYPVMIPGRDKVGDNQGTSKLAHLELATGKLTWLTLTPDSSVTSRAGVGEWSDDGRYALLTVTAANNKTRWTYSVASAGGTMTTLDVLRDSAWVNGPCGFGCSGWLPDGRAYYVNEATDYAHLYTVNADGTNERALTSGNWEVLSVQLSDDRRTFELNTSEPSPFTRQHYRLPITGGARTRITVGDGGHQAIFAPDGQRYVTIYSEENLPPELYLTRVGSTTKDRLTTSTSDEFRRYDWKKPPIVMVPGEDGTPVPARLYRPQDHGAQPNGAGVIFVHGAGYLHNIHNWWSTYSREYMFHHFLATRGYTVIDIDYRGSAGYGRDWRTAIYRHMGGWDLNDHVSGSKYLTSQLGINPERIGIYGGSYGGFITLMALFTKPEYFGAGAALRSVTDWAHYNHGYTSNILNTPQTDTLAFRRSSPIFFAEGLVDPLLILHGMVDTNVQFQDVVQLVQRLIELEKTGWDMAVYPVEDHGFTRPSSWNDEYRRIFELFERTIGPNGSKARP